MKNGTSVSGVINRVRKWKRAEGNQKPSQMLASMYEMSVMKWVKLREIMRPEKQSDKVQDSDFSPKYNAKLLKGSWQERAIIRLAFQKEHFDSLCRIIWTGKHTETETNSKA